MKWRPRLRRPRVCPWGPWPMPASCSTPTSWYRSGGRCGRGNGSETMLGRFGIRQKLSLLLLIPLAAVVMTMVPFTAERVDDARSAAATARSGLTAREIGVLVQSIQQERLLAL